MLNTQIVFSNILNKSKSLVDEAKSAPQDNNDKGIYTTRLYTELRTHWYQFEKDLHFFYPTAFTFNPKLGRDVVYDLFLLFSLRST